MDNARVEAEENARRQAQRMGHDLGPFTLVDGTVLYQARCVRCDAVVKVYPFIPMTAEGSAVDGRCLESGR